MTKNRGFNFPQFGFGSSEAVAASIPDGHIDQAILALGHLILIGWLPTDGSPATTSVKLPGVGREAVRPAFVRHARDDVSSQFEKAGRRAPFKAGFVCTVPLGKQAQAAIRKCIASKSEIGIVIETEVGVERPFVIVPTALAEAMRSAVMTRQRLHMALQSMSAAGSTGSDEVIELLQGIDAPAILNAHVEVALTADKRRMLVAGWAEGASQGVLLLVNGDLTESPQRLDPVLIPRNDVAVHLHAMGSNTRTNLHGFVAVADIDGQKDHRLCRLDTDGARWSAELEIDPRSVPAGEVLGTMRRLAMESTQGAAEGFRRLARAVIGSDTPPAPRVAEVYIFLPSEKIDADTRTSIIVPFYGDAFYLVDHLMSQRRAPADVEWVFVCDDPRLAAQMLAALSNRQCLITQRTTLVLLEANGGFAHANNIGARYAKGRYLLLMNSDIYCESFAFIDHAVALLERRPEVGCAGFSLQFEDGTIQHDGMQFERAQWLNGLWACEHTNKGMPQAWRGFSDVDAEAVTAALLLLRKADFAGNEIFDPVYLIGDFEDADLCMRLREQGKTIALMRTPGLFHLERQSVRHAGDLDSRRAFTHLNSHTFNDRWGHKLGATLAQVSR